MGILHLDDKNADIAKRINDKLVKSKDTQTEVQKEGDIFAHVYQDKDKKIEVDTSKGEDLWNQFIALIKDKKQKELIKRTKFIGMKNNRFCINIPDEDIRKFKETGLENMAKKFFKCEGSLAPVFYLG